VEDARRHRLGEAQGALGPCLRLADEAPEDPRHLEAEERQAPRPGNRACREALPRAGHAEEQDALGQVARREPPRQRVGRAGQEGALAPQPGLERSQPAHVVQGLRRDHQIQEPRRAHARGLLVLDRARHGGHALAVPHERERERVLGLVPGQPAGRLEHRVADLGGYRDPGRADQLVDEAAQRRA
jgi:hypothetical protein